DNDLWQPVHAAACWAQPDLVELICEYGGDINAKTSSGEAPLDLCEDDTTRAVIATMQQQEARKKRMAFGVRDSRRQSRRRKKFESPQQVATGGDNPFSARGAIRRLSLRDRSGLAPARIEAQKEGADIIRYRFIDFHHCYFVLLLIV
ncbi:ankyrin repeat protein, partial [Ancylostoma duodenale]